MMWCTSFKKTTNRQRKMTNNLCEVLVVKDGLFTSEVPKNQTTWPQLKSCCSDTDPKPEIFDYCIVTWSWMKYFHKTMLVTEVRETCSRFTVALGSTLLIRQWLFWEWCFYQVVVGPWLVTQTSPLPQWTSTHSAASHDEDMMKTDVVPVPHVLSDETLTKKQPTETQRDNDLFCLFVSMVFSTGCHGVLIMWCVSVCADVIRSHGCSVFSVKRLVFLFCVCVWSVSMTGRKNLKVETLSLSLTLYHFIVKCNISVE